MFSKNVPRKISFLTQMWLWGSTGWGSARSRGLGSWQKWLPSQLHPWLLLWAWASSSTSREPSVSLLTKWGWCLTCRAVLSFKWDNSQKIARSFQQIVVSLLFNSLMRPSFRHFANCLTPVYLVYLKTQDLTRTFLQPSGSGTEDTKAQTQLCSSPPCMLWKDIALWAQRSSNNDVGGQGVRDRKGFTVL